MYPSIYVSWYFISCQVENGVRSSDLAQGLIGLCHVHWPLTYPKAVGGLGEWNLRTRVVIAG